MNVTLLPDRERQLEMKSQQTRLARLAPGRHPLHSLSRVLVHTAVAHTFALEALASKGARTPGVDGVTALKAKRRLAAFVATIMTATKAGALMPLARLDIPKADGGARSLSLPVLHERAIGKALAWMLDIIFGPSFAPGVVGCRPGFGPHDALAIAVDLVSTTRWVVKVDFQDFFGSIRHDLLVTRLARRVSDKKLLHLLQQMMRRALPGAPPRVSGIAQGCPASPTLANILAQVVDEWLTAAGVRFVRYLDDILLVPTGTLLQVERFVQDLAAFALTVGLELAPNKTIIASTEEGVPFLGHLVFRTSAGEGHVQPHLDRVVRFRSWMHERADALAIATNQEEVRIIKNQMFNRMRGFSDYYLPHRDSLQIAAHAFHEATQNYPICHGLIDPRGSIPGSRRNA